jgi:hypothetical protein
LPKWRMTGGKLPQAYGVMTKLVHLFLTRIWSSPRSWQGSCQKQRDKEMKKELVWTCEAFIANFAGLSLPSRQCSYCWWVAEGEEHAGQPRPHPGGLLEGVGGGCKKYRIGGLRWGAEVICTLREVCRDRWRPGQENLEIQIVLSLFLYISAVQVVSFPTPYVIKGAVIFKTWVFSLFRKQFRALTGHR